MARFFVFLVVVGGTGFFMYTTKPTKADYLQKIEARSQAIASVDQDGFAQIRGGDPFDNMVNSGTSQELLERTYVDDYVIISVFTTAYETEGYGPQEIRTYGLFSTLLNFR